MKLLDTDKKKILIIGKNSFISKNYVKLSKFNKKIKVINYKQINEINFDKFTHLINFSYDSKIKHRNYKFTNLIDKKICNLIKGKEIVYIYPSSRLVYKKKNFFSNFKDFYSKNKLLIEKEIKFYRKKKYLILRIANILAFDLKKKNLFLPYLLNSLKKDGIVKFNIYKNTYKDFITLEYFSKNLDKLIELGQTGTLNMSSGHKLGTHVLASQIIKGFGRGRILYEKKLYKDSFILNNQKLKKITGISISKKKIKDYCFEIGLKLKNYE